MVSSPIVELVRLRMGMDRLPLDDSDDAATTVRAVLEFAIRRLNVRPGEVLIAQMDTDHNFDNLLAAIGGTDTVYQRSANIWDIYQAGFGTGLLQACAANLHAHHTQIRRITLPETTVLQVAMYPDPLVAHNVRMWCDPALIVIFTLPGALPDVVHQFKKFQPLWERLRAHHGIPLLEESPPELLIGYPSPNRLSPLGAADWLALQMAVIYIATEQAISDVTSTASSPQRAVDHVLAARRHVHRHQSRLLLTLEHTHGSIDEKFRSLREAVATAFPSFPESVDHILAPHRHLMNGMKETRDDVADLASRASDTASLVASATIGRLLDRSEANRTAQTVTGATLVVIALITTFTAIASIPSEETSASMVRISGWVGVGGIVTTAFVLGLAKLASRPAVTNLVLRQRLRWALFSALILAVTGLFVGAVTGAFWEILVGFGCAAVGVGAYALMNEFR